MDQIQNGWWSEVNEMWEGQAFSMKVKEVLYQEKSEYQDILLFESTNNGRVLVLDGIIQCSEKDEFAYQEMITFLPICCHPNPERVLIVGGGDGGVAREVQKHPFVKEIVQVEIDEKVVMASKQFLPFMAKGFDSSKVELIIGDGFEYMRNHKNEFDVIITDSSDPVGPAVNLFTESYYKLLKEALKPGGIISNQCGSIWTDLPMIKETMSNARQHFKTVLYSTSNVPTYPNGQIGYLVGAIDAGYDLQIPKFKFTEEDLEKLEIKYYSSDVHTASFTVPNFVRKVIY